MEKKLEIKKLADIVVWADSKIRDGGYNEEKYNNDGATAYCHVKANELWRIRDVALETMERQTVYTNALNKDIADKAAKIDLLEKEIEGRKEGYTALKELMDTKYIPIDEHDNVCKDYEKKVERLNRCLKMQEDLTRDWKNKYVEAQKEIDEWESDTNEHETITQYKELVDGLKKDLNYWKEAFETQATSLAEVRKLNDELVDTLNKSSDEVEKLEKQVEYLKKELDQTCTCKELDLKGHQSRETALVNTLADKNDEIKELKEEIEELKKKNFDDFKRRDTDIINQAKRICELEEELDRWKNQERIRTDQLRATESKVEELYRQIGGLRRANRIAVNNAYGLASASIREEDDHGREGFERYIKYIISEEEGKFKEELNKRFSEEVSKISMQRTEEELAKAKEAEVKGVGRTSSGRYPWGAKVNDIPCGEDAIE